MNDLTNRINLARSREVEPMILAMDKPVRLSVDVSKASYDLLVAFETSVPGRKPSHQKVVRALLEQLQTDPQLRHQITKALTAE